MSRLQSFIHTLLVLVAVFNCVAAVSAYASDIERPNILWITSEDNSIAWVGCYGSKNAKTPHIDALAEEGFRYTHCFDNAAVCAPTRSTWITGHYAISIGTQPMRSRYRIPHELVPYYPDQLKKIGYHVSNGGKTDYNIGSRDDKATWLDAEGKRPKRADGQKFFQIINIGDSHESNAFPRRPDIHADPATMQLAAYHPDLPEVRTTYARYADAIGRMDEKVGAAIAQLKADGLYEDTIVIYCSDHGAVLARSKRFLYSSGTHCPLIVRIPEKWKAWWPAEKPGSTVDRIVSFVDMPKTWLSLAGAEVPEGYQGRIFLGPDTEPAPAHHLNFRERADEACDLVRGMRDERYAYIKNYMPWAPNGQKLQYMYTMEASKAWHRHHQEGKTDAITGRFFRPRVSEEFYDTVTDFDNVDNLIDAEEHQAKIAELKTALRAKQLELYDSGLLPEAMRLRRAEENQMTIYAMVRDPQLYPLAAYLDAADLALARDRANLSALTEMLQSDDEGLRYWAVCGLYLLKADAEPATDGLKTALDDSAGEVAMMAAWALDTLGHTALANSALEQLKRHPRSDSRLYECLRRWMGRDVWDPNAAQPAKNKKTKTGKPMAGLVTTWQISGPHPGKSSDSLDDFATAFATDTKWQLIEKGIESSRIDVQATIGEHDDCSAYVRTSVVSPEAQTIAMQLSADDHARAVLNGRLVTGDQLKLKKGSNDLVLIVIDHKKGWRFTCVLTRDGKPVPGLTFRAE